MSRQRFLDIKRSLHLADNDLLESTNDTMFKVRPLMELLNKKFRQHGIFHEAFSIDESIIIYFGHHPCKQFIRGKPIRFGYKNLMLCSADGYCYAFDTYCGKSITPNARPLGSRVVLSLLEALPKPSDHNVFFDNFFTSHSLLVSLQKLGFRATGTIRENRLSGCPLPTKKKLERKKRGKFCFCFDPENGGSFFKWKDNSIVTMATNYDTVKPLCSVNRWSSSEKKKVKVPQPHLFSSYNSGMGGVDLHNQTVNNYRIRIRGKKWWWPLFTQMINMTVANAWRIYQLTGDSRLDLLSFTRIIARP